METSILFVILGLALVDSINPSALAVTFYLLTKEKAVPKILIYVTAIFCTYFTVGLLLTAGADSLFHTFGDMLDGKVSYIVQVIIGTVILVYALFAKVDKSKEVMRRNKLHSLSSLGAVFMLGVVVTLVEFSTALPYLATIGILAQTEIAFMNKIAILVGYSVVLIIPPLLVLALGNAVKRRYSATLKAWQNNLQKGSRETWLWILGIIGFLLVVDGIRYFLV